MDIAQISWHDFQHWHRTGEQPNDYEFAVWLPRYIKTPEHLPQKLLDYDWTRSFQVPVVIVYDEWVTVENLEIFHNFLRSQAADIENITLVITSAIGVAEWWQQRTDLFHTRSFRIREWLYVRCTVDRRYFNTWDQPVQNYLEKIQQDQSLEFLFAHYAGARTDIVKQYLALRLKELDQIGVVDSLSEFDRSKEELLNHAHWVSYFQDPQEAKLIDKLYDKHVDGDELVLDPVLETIPVDRIKNEFLNCQGFQYHLDCRCLAVVVSETDNVQPWTTLTEKTIRPLFHHKIVIHTNYKAIENLERYGFWFPHDIVDYSYQYETDWLTRINGMIASIRQAYSLLQTRYQEYWSDNRDKFQHNAELLFHYYHSDADPDEHTDSTQNSHSNADTAL